MRKNFPTGMGEAPLRWWSSLPEGNIVSWKNLAQAFSKRFVTSQARVATMLDLYPIRQEKHEKLKQFNKPSTASYTIPMRGAQWIHSKLI